MKNLIQYILLTVMALLVLGCGVTIENVRFGWPVESVLAVNDQNVVDDGDHSITFSVARIAQAEFEDSTALRGKEIRLLKSDEGYYFLTAKRFKNVYVLSPSAGALYVTTTIEVAPRGLVNPAMNQRPPLVELVDGTRVIKLTANDIFEGAK